MQFPPSALATRLLGHLSRGIEIGASGHNPFHLPGCLFVDYTDRQDTMFAVEAAAFGAPPQRIDVVALGDRLPFADGYFDYVVTSHVVEHFFDPIAAIEEWFRVVRPGGYIFCIVPHKERTFDRDQPRTTLQELLARHRGEIRLDGPDLHQHHSFWTTVDVVELCVHFGWPLVAVQDVDDKVGNGFTIVLQRPEISAQAAIPAGAWARARSVLKAWSDRGTKPSKNVGRRHAAAAPANFAFNVEDAWVGQGGTYVTGWACAGSGPLEDAVIEIGGVRIPITHFFDRPDVAKHFPLNPGARRSGFEVFVGGTAPTGVLEFRTAAGIVRQHLPIADYVARSLPLHPASAFGRVPVGAARFRLALGIEKFWADRHGYFFGGWAHGYDRAFECLEIAVDGRRSTVASWSERSDLAAHFPDHPNATRAGFELYVEAPPGYPIELTAKSADGAQQTWRLLPPHAPLTPQVFSAPIGPIASYDACNARLAAHIAETKGVVVELGARKVSAYYVDHRALFPHARRYIGVDIHPGTGVDIVGDAHSLSQVLLRDSVDGLISHSVLEHLACPWLVAAEINKVLRPGGLVLLTAPWTWPGHEYPNDFWRFSEHGLAVLFGPASGFETLSAGQFGDYRVYPDNNLSAYLQMPLIPAYAASYIFARKVVTIDDGAVRWPMATDSLQVKSRTYPVRPG